MSYIQDTDDEEMQRALALSLEEFDSPPPAGAGGAGPSKPSSGGASREAKPTTAEDKNNTNNSTKSPETTRFDAAAKDKQQPTTKKRARGGKKLPVFNPSSSEIEGCFKELDETNRGVIGVPELMQTSAKLGMGLDQHQAAAMMEWAVKHGAMTGGRMRAEQFKSLVEHFRVE